MKSWQIASKCKVCTGLRSQKKLSALASGSETRFTPTFWRIRESTIGLALAGEEGYKVWARPRSPDQKACPGGAKPGANHPGSPTP
jgi:hypothetical protein